MALVGSLALLVPVSSGAPQDEEVLPDDQGIVAALVKDVTKSKRKREADAETIRLIEKLGTMFPRSGPKDRERIAGVTGDCLKVRRKPLEGEDPEKTWMLPLAAAEALGSMHPESAKDLAKSIKSKAFRENPALFGATAEAIALARDEDALDLLLGLLDAKGDVPIQSRLVSSLRHFEFAPEKQRKEAFEKVLDVFLEMNDRMDDSNDLLQGLRIGLIFESSSIGTLKKLSGHSETTAKDWERWWKENRRKPWPDPPKPEETDGPM